MTEEKVHWARTTSMKSGFIKSFRKMRGNPANRRPSGARASRVAAIVGYPETGYCPSSSFLRAEPEAPRSSVGSPGAHSHPDPHSTHSWAKENGNVPGKIRWRVARNKTNSGNIVLTC